jgi:hypothetical protein
MPTKARNSFQPGGIMTGRQKAAAFVNDLFRTAQENSHLALRFAIQAHAVTEGLMTHPAGADLQTIKAIHALAQKTNQAARLPLALMKAFGWLMETPQTQESLEGRALAEWSTAA